MSQLEFDLAALELVTQFGGPGVYEKYTLGAYDPATASATTGAVGIPATVAIFDLNRPNNGLGTKLGDGDSTGRQGMLHDPATKQGQASILPVDTVNDNIIVGGVRYSIVTMKEVNPSGTDPLLYLFYLRR